MAKKPPPSFDPRSVLAQIAADTDQTAVHRIRAARAMLAAEPKRQPEPVSLRVISSAQIERPGAMPTAEMYRAIGIHRFQDRTRIETTVKPAVDRALAARDPEVLLAIAGDISQPPESRLVARDRYVMLCEAATASHEARVGDVTSIEAMVAGLDALRWADPTRFCSLLCAFQPGGAEPEPRPAEQGLELEAAQG